jgi:hypothetical protein
MAGNLPAAMNWNAVFAYPLAPDGSVGPRRTLVDYWGRRTGIDGMAVDVEGNLYAARVSAVPQDRGIAVFSPSGQELAFVPTQDNPTEPRVRTRRRASHFVRDGTRESVQDQDPDGRIPSVREVIPGWRPPPQGRFSRITMLMRTGSTPDITSLPSRRFEKMRAQLVTMV